MDSTLALVINLAICDFMYCSISLPIFLVGFWSQTPAILNPHICLVTGAIRNILKLADWMTVGIISFVRFTRLTGWHNIEKHGKYFIIGVWIYAATFFSTMLFTVGHIVLIILAHLFVIIHIICLHSILKLTDPEYRGKFWIRLSHRKL